MNILNSLLLLRARLRAPLWQREPIRAEHNPQPKTILVTGGTGFVGRHLCRSLIERGERVIVLTRRLEVARNLYGPHAEAIASLDQIPASRRIDAIVNLAGARILGLPWTGARRKELVQSRVSITNALVALIARLDSKPEVLVNGSAIGYYGVRGDEKITETARGQPIFQSHLCQLWELAAQAAEQHGVRVCRLRFGLVLGRDGGAFPGLMRPARLRMLLVLGSGAQWVSWIHVDDVVRLIDFCIVNSELSGGINATAPQPLRQTTFATMIAAQFGHFGRLGVPASFLRFALGESAQLLVNGQRVLPVKARAAGFTFRYSSFETALDELLAPDDVPRAPVEIMYDPQCPVCNMEVNRYCRDAVRAGVKWRVADVAHRPELMQRYGLDTATARKRVYVLDDRGEMTSGMEAIVLIWSALPGWQPLARFARLPVVRNVLHASYDLVLAPTIWRWNERRRARADTTGGTSFR
jgi:uncharacterized protein (TIGR01777 family)